MDGSPRAIILSAIVALSGCAGNIHMEVNGVGRAPPKLVAGLTAVADAVTTPLCQAMGAEKKMLDGEVVEHNGRITSSRARFAKDCSTR